MIISAGFALGFGFAKVPWLAVALASGMNAVSIGAWNSVSVTAAVSASVLILL